MKKILKALRVPAIVLLFITSFIACDEDFNVLDSNVLGKDNANFIVDTLRYPIVSYNKRLNDLQINNLPSNLLGFFDDPDYGSTTASIVTDIVPENFTTTFGTNIVIDSVVLRIPYFSRATGFDSEGLTEYTINDSLYGNSGAPIKLSIYENGFFLRDFNPNNLNEPQNYYSFTGNMSVDNIAQTENTTINFDALKKGPAVLDTIIAFSNKPTITITETDTIRAEPSLRLRLDEQVDGFWETKIVDIIGEAEFSNANNFKNHFRGLYFKTESVSGDGSMVMLNLASTDAQISMHYTEDDPINDGERLTRVFNFNFNGSRLNTFINDYITLNDGDSVNGDETLNLKGTDGSMAVINLFDGLVDCDGDGNVDDDALECFKNSFRAKDSNGDYIKDDTTGDFILKKLINEAHLLVHEDNTSISVTDEKFHRYDRIYAYDVKNNITLADYIDDPITDVASPLSSKVIHLSQRDTIEKNYRIRLTEHLNNILLRDSTNTKIGLTLSTNVNLTATADILDSSDDVTRVPSVSIITPRGTFLHGSNSSDSKKRMELKVFATEPK